MKKIETTHLGMETLDAQHREIFEALYRLTQHIPDSAIALSLIDNIISLFGTHVMFEMNFIRIVAFDDEYINHHKHEHSALMASIIAIRKNTLNVQYVDCEMVHMLISRLERHIASEDVDFARKFLEYRKQFGK